jgi:hypothetical protein
MTVTQLPEQPRTMRVDVPYITATKPILIVNSVVLGEMVGLSTEEFSIQRANYGTVVGQNPVIPIYAHFWMSPYDGTTTSSYEIYFRHRFRILFYNLNTFSTTVPTLLSGESKVNTLKPGDIRPPSTPTGWFA